MPQLLIKDHRHPNASRSCKHRHRHRPRLSQGRKEITINKTGNHQLISPTPRKVFGEEAVMGVTGVVEIVHQNSARKKCVRSAEWNHTWTFYIVQQIIRYAISATNDDIFRRSVGQRDGVEISETIDGTDRILEREAKTHRATQWLIIQ